MSARVPIPPPTQRKPNLIGKDRVLQTSLQLPREARWSRPSSIVLSILVHIALFLVIKPLIWKPVPEKGPVFQVFRLSSPKETPQHIATPVMPPPATTRPIPETSTERPIVRAQPPESAPAPQITEPVTIPTTLPPQGVPLAEPTGESRASNPPGTAAERLLRTVSPGIPGATSAVPLPTPLTPQQAAAARMANGIQSINDSIAAAVAAANGVTDWTKTDKNGNKWGVTPGQLHLGSITLPLPFYFQTPPGRRDDAAKSARIYAESNAQAKRLEMEETFESRVKAMRKRKDAERDSARAAKTGH